MPIPISFSADFTTYHAALDRKGPSRFRSQRGKRAHSTITSKDMALSGVAWGKQGEPRSIGTGAKTHEDTNTNTCRSKGIIDCDFICLSLFVCV